MNRLTNATSPYLLQHADNPVDWWPWCDEAFAEAARRDVPVMLSVGYAACHWCHVMAHESFEDPDTAALLDEHVVAVKVDREERPDVDAVYMTATQAMTGQGGWPMTVFMTPQKEPFFCGTYFPRDHFRQLVLSISRAWRNQREGLAGQGRQVVTALAENAAATARALRAGGPGGDDEPGARFGEIADAAVATLQRGYDAVHGGFGGAPKFPPSMVVEFLLRYHRRTGAPAALRMAEGTCEAMARGGMYDQLFGGFARYSVDAAWVVPHFEKMLYDNALLARVYLNLWRATGSELGRRVAEEACEWMLHDLRTPDGGFAASLDADSEGEEGKFYVWRPAELNAVLGPQDGEFAARALGVTETGTFERGASVLQRRAEPADADRFARVRRALLAARDDRVRPARDDKAVAAWNGLAISALAECGLLLGQPHFIDAARVAAALLADVHMRGSKLIRTSRDGVPGDTAGVLEDYACVAEGFLVLSGVTGEGRWAALAGKLLEGALGAFGDGQGGFYDTAADGELLIFRPADPADNATPSGTFAAAGALLSYAALTGSARHREAAEAALGVLPVIAARYARAAGAGLAVAEAWLAGPPEIAVVGDPDDERTRALLRTALQAAPPGAVLALGDGAEATVPLLAGRGLVDEAPAAYVCRQFSCQAPVTMPQQLTQVLARPYQTGGPPDWTLGGRSGILDAMRLITDVVPRLWLWLRRALRVSPGRSGSVSLVPVLVSVLVVAGTAVAAVLAATGAKPAGDTGSDPPIPSTRPAPAKTAVPVVPLLGGNTDNGGVVPVAPVSPAAIAGTSAAASAGKVAPLHALRQADLLVVAPFSLSRQVVDAVSRQHEVTSAVPIEAAKVKINGAYTAVLGVDPSTFRGYAAGPTAASDPLWQGVASGGVAVSYTMGTLDRLSLGRAVTVTGQRQERLRVVAFGTVGIGGVDAVVSDSIARSLGMPTANAIVISAPPGSVASLAGRIKTVIPPGAAVEPLVTQVTRPSAAGVTPASGAVGDGAMTAAQLTTALQAAESRQGLPYVWGAAGPGSFDCSGLVQWSFAQAGVRMPRVAADQARTGPAVPVSQLEPGDLLFYHTDPTAPGYISHVAIYLGNGWMIQAPQPGLRVQVVPANFGSQFAGAIRVYPQIAAEVAAGLA